jgi:hypothetical protein
MNRLRPLMRLPKDFPGRRRHDHHFFREPLSNTGTSRRASSSCAIGPGCCLDFFRFVLRITDSRREERRRKLPLWRQVAAARRRGSRSRASQSKRRAGAIERKTLENEISKTVAGGLQIAPVGPMDRIGFRHPKGVRAQYDGRGYVGSGGSGGTIPSDRAGPGHRGGN